MNFSWVILTAFALAIGMVTLVVVLAAYSWGRYAWAQALRTAGSRAKAYVTAILPAIVSAICFERNPQLTELTSYALLMLGAPAAIGVAMRSREITS